MIVVENFFGDVAVRSMSQVVQQCGRHDQLTALGGRGAFLRKQIDGFRCHMHDADAVREARALGALVSEVGDA